MIAGQGGWPLNIFLSPDDLRRLLAALSRRGTLRTPRILIAKRFAATTTQKNRICDRVLKHFRCLHCQLPASGQLNGDLLRRV